MSGVRVRMGGLFGGDSSLEWIDPEPLRFEVRPNDDGTIDEVLIYAGTWSRWTKTPTGSRGTATAPTATGISTFTDAASASRSPNGDTQSAGHHDWRAGMTDLEMQRRGWAFAQKASDEHRAEKYERGQAVRAAIMARLDRVLDRIVVANQFEALHSGTVAQLTHALHFAEYGDNEPEDGPPIYVSRDSAEALVRILADAFDNGYRPRTPLPLDDEEPA